MSRLQARVEKLESSSHATEQKTEELETTPEEEQAWQAWETQNIGLDFDKMLEEIKNRPPDLEYEKLTTAHEQAEYLRRKYDAFLDRKHDPMEEKRVQDLRAKKKEEFICDLRAKAAAAKDWESQ